MVGAGVVVVVVVVRLTGSRAPHLEPVLDKMLLLSLLPLQPWDMGCQGGLSYPRVHSQGV